MEPEPTVLDSLRKAVDAMPDDVPLRLHLATLLLAAGQQDEAVRQLGAVLQRDPGNAQALSLLREPGGAGEPGPARAAGEDTPGRGGPAEGVPGAGVPGEGPGGNGKKQQYDWSQAEDELRDVLPAMFVGEGDAADSASAGIDEADAYDPEHAGLTLADVAGMTEVKERLEAAFLAPMRNPDLRGCTASRCAADCCFTGRRDAARRSSPARSRASWAPGSSRCRSPTSSTCSSGRASGTSTSCSR